MKTQTKSNYRTAYEELVVKNTAARLNIDVKTLQEYLQTSVEASKLYQDSKQESFTMFNKMAVELKDQYLKDN